MTQNNNHFVTKSSVKELLDAYKILPLPVIVVTLDLKKVWVNPAALSIACNPNAKPDETSPENLVHPEIWSYISKRSGCVTHALKPLKGKLQIAPTQDNIIYFEINLSLANISGNMEVIIVALKENTREETYRKRIETIRKSFDTVYPGRLEESVLFKRLNEAVMQSANTIVITDLDGKIVFANPKFQETTGYTLKEAYMQNPRILKSGEQPETYYKELWQTVSAGNVWKGEFKNKNKRGGYYWESATITPIKDNQGNVIEYLAIKEDITERKSIEEKLEQTLMEMEVSNWEYKVLNEDLKQEVERRKNAEGELKLQKELLQELNENLENQIQQEVAKNREKDELMTLQSRQAAMGEMIGNIAHQWRQPLNAIGLMVYDLADALRFGEISPEYIDKSEADIKAVLNHMSQTIDDFRHFFKPNKDKKYFLLNDVVKTSVSFLEAPLKNSGIKLISEVDKDIMLYGYASEFAQVLLNIINNARDAFMDNLPNNPTIRIVAKKQGGNAVIRIIDNAGGIPPEIMHKIFDPYFTTKEQGKGTGVGLYMSKTIIERNMNGTISAHNLQNGAEFTITTLLEYP